MRVAITGKPGVGKTTACLKIYESLKDSRQISGFITNEIRERGLRIGFVIIDLSTGEETLLARKEEGLPRVGKYRVFVENMDAVAERIQKSWCTSDTIIIDEVGPMELKSREFVSAMERLLESERDLIVTVHYRSNHPLVMKIKREFEVVTLTPENRNQVVKEVLKKIDS
ncbi:NTPase [Geoglobus acetivorans]|uniref:Nucleoside-triphosphatase GACE_1317 n=1 Tax=Geoglobus acetivorans TaxID=565033 RepID=A0A0A7GEW9_GEOAI|nr:nucleoside triphosphatase [Geoglobus acetivorans]